MARQYRVVDHVVEQLILINRDQAICEYHLTAPRALLTRIVPLTGGDRPGATGDFAGAASIRWGGRKR
jgi:hypothetical protein